MWSSCAISKFFLRAYSFTKVHAEFFVRKLVIIRQFRNPLTWLFQYSFWTIGSVDIPILHFMMSNSLN